MISTFFSSLKAAFAALNRALYATIFFSLFHFSLSGSLFYETIKITFSRRILRRQRRIFFFQMPYVWWGGQTGLFGRIETGDLFLSDFPEVILRFLDVQAIKCSNL